MRKLILTLSLMIFGLTTVMAQGNDQLNDKANKFIKDHYSNERIDKVKVRKDKNAVSGYEVKLANKTTLEFDKNGELIEVDGDTRIPDGALPQNIVSYVQKNYSSTFIREYEREEGEQEVELDNGVELIFDDAGNFIEVD